MWQGWLGFFCFVVLRHFFGLTVFFLPSFSHGVHGSAVCSFRLSDIDDTFRGPFKFQPDPRSPWVTQRNPNPNFNVSGVLFRLSAKIWRDSLYIGGALPRRILQSGFCLSFTHFWTLQKSYMKNLKSENASQRLIIKMFILSITFSWENVGYGYSIFHKLWS